MCIKMHFFNYIYRSIYKKNMKYLKGQKFRKLYQYQKKFYSTTLWKTKKINQNHKVRINQSLPHKGRQNRKKTKNIFCLLTICLDHGGGPSFNSSGRSSSNCDEGDMQSNSRPPSDMPPSLDELENFMTSMKY